MAAEAMQYDEKTLDDCGTLYDDYLQRMNTLSDKTWIATQLILDTDNENFSFMNSYLTYPEREVKNIFIYPESAIKKLMSSYDKDYGISAYSGQDLKAYIIE